MPQKATFNALAVFYVAMGAIPLGFVFFQSVYINDGISFEIYKELLLLPKNIELFFKSVMLSLSVVILSSFFGVIIAAVLRYVDIYFKKFFLFAFMVPLILPPYIMALAFSKVFGEWIFSFYGVVFIESTIYLGIVLLATYILLGNIDKRLYESASMFCGWFCVFRHISLPLVKPYIFFISTLVFLLSFGNYSVVNFLGYKSFVMQSFIEFSAFYNYRVAYALSFVVLVIVFVAFYMKKLYAKKEKFEMEFNIDEKISYTNRPRYAFAIFGAFVMLVFFLVVLPIYTLIVDSKGFGSYIQAFMLIKESMFRSVLYALVGGFLVVFFGFATAYKKTVSKRYNDLLDISLLVFFALSGSILGMGFLVFFNTSWGELLYMSPLLLIFGYIVKYTLISHKIIYANILQIKNSYLESAKILGAGYFDRIRYIILPLLKGSFLYSFIVVFIFLLRDTDITMMLYRAGSDTMSIKIFTLMANTPSEIVSALCVMMVFISVLLLMVLAFMGRFV